MFTSLDHSMTTRLIDERHARIRKGFGSSRRWRKS